MAALRVRSAETSAAFSLVEIVIALGIISFALVGILGLFPAAMDAATNSQRETQAAFIAHAIYTDMTSMPGTNTFIATSTNFYDNPSRTDDKISINLATTNSYYLAYGSSGEPIKELDKSSFPSGNSAANYLARITVSTNNIPVGLSRVDVQIDAPGVAPEKSRSAYYFSTLLNQGENP